MQLRPRGRGSSAPGNQNNIISRFQLGLFQTVDLPETAAALADMLAQFAGECDYNVGVGQVLGAVAVRWEELL